jgi:type II secretory pathway pseudopilin PulG
LANRTYGLTLVELLVVVVILTTLVAAALPVMAPSSETRRLREAARSLNTMITTAQSKATELGRPFGIWLEKQSIQTQRAEDRGAVMTVFYCEEPAPFGGFDENSAAILQFDGSTGQFMAVFGSYDPLTAQFVRQALPPGIFRPGDLLELHDKVFQILPGPANQVDASTGYLQTTDRLLLGYSGTPGPFLYVTYQPNPPISGFGSNTWTLPQPYTIRRQPQKVDDPLQLPAGIAIDLEASGDRSRFFHDPLRPDAPVSSDSPVAILFSPGGALHSVYRNEGGDGTATFGAQQVMNDAGDGAIHFMIAKRELVGESQLEPTKASWLDPESLWVSVAPQTGRVVTEVNSVTQQAALVAQDYTDLVRQRLDSRAFAQKMQSIGGR